VLYCCRRYNIIIIIIVSTASNVINSAIPLVQNTMRKTRTKVGRHKQVKSENKLYTQTHKTLNRTAYNVCELYTEISVIKLHVYRKFVNPREACWTSHSIILLYSRYARRDYNSICVTINI